MTAEFRDAGFLYRSNILLGRPMPQTSVERIASSVQSMRYSLCTIRSESGISGRTSGASVLDIRFADPGWPSFQPPDAAQTNAPGVAGELVLGVK